MKLKFFTTSLILSFLAQITPASGIDIKKFPCGDGATYSVLMPAGVAMDGTNCSGPVFIDSSVKIIDSGAFRESKVTSVVIPNSVITIGSGAFSRTGYLNSVSIPNSVTNIERMAFFESSLASVNIPDSVSTLGEMVFMGSLKLNSVSISNSLNELPRYAFAYTGLTSVAIPNSVAKIREYAFSNSKLLTLNIPNSVREIQEYAFFGNPLTSIISLGSISEIAPGLFGGTKITSLDIPISVKKIGNNALGGLPIKSIVIPPSVTSIEDYALSNNVYLERVSIPDELLSLGKGVFERNFSLSRIEYCGNLTGLPIAPICPPERQALIDKKAKAKADAEAKAKADAEAKAKADAEENKKLQAIDASCKSARAESSRLKDAIYAAIAKFPNSVNSISKILSDDVFFNACPDLNRLRILSLELEASILAASSRKSMTIICIKGKLTKKVTGFNPKCPSGYRKK